MGRGGKWEKGRGEEVEILIEKINKKQNVKPVPHNTIKSNSSVFMMNPLKYSIHYLGINIE